MANAIYARFTKIKLDTGDVPAYLRSTGTVFISRVADPEEDYAGTGSTTGLITYDPSEWEELSAGDNPVYGEIWVRTAGPTIQVSLTRHQAFGAIAFGTKRLAGKGTPAGNVAAPKGSIWHDLDAGALYLKTSGDAESTSGWQKVTQS